MTEAILRSPRQLTNRLLVPLFVVLSALPVVYVLTQALLASRNAAYWDEVDDVLGLILRLDRGGSWQDALGRFFAVSNEHRMLTSRLLFAGSYWTTGTVNFTVIGIIGNLFVCGLCGLLVATAGAIERKVQMGVLLAALIFQLEHYENFLWSGASIDHFQVVLLAGAAFIALARGTRAALLGAGLLGLLATFTLAHGLMVWPVGLLVLAAQRRWSGLRLWLGLAVAVVVVFFSGFEFNPAHHVGDFSAAGLGRILCYWLTLLGSPLALGQQAVAPYLGVGLLVLLGRQIASGAFARERIVLPLALWAVASLMLVAIGRVDFAQGNVASRYYVLGALAWAMALFMQFEVQRVATRPYRFLLCALPALVLFNLIADANFAPDAHAWVSHRDSAIENYMRTGKDGAGQYPLMPDSEHATRLLQEVEQAGIYRMPQSVHEQSFPTAELVTDMTYSVDRIEAGDRMVAIEGWAAFAGQVAKPGQVYVVFESAKSRHIFATQTMVRPDVASTYPGQRWAAAGFRFERRRWLLPKEDFQVGLLIQSVDGAEYMMTAKRVDLTETGTDVEPGVVHPNGNIYDRVILRSAAVTVTAEPKRITRVSFLDATDTLVHAEFSGAGTLTLTLEHPSGPAAPRIYNQPRMAYMKGHPSIVIAGADETTNLAVFSVQSPKAVSRPRGAMGLAYDGLAHVASVSIASVDGKFGAVRTANVSYSATAGRTGIYAPGVQFTGPVFVGDINAMGAATPVLQLGAAIDTRITGGDLFQANGRPVTVSGIARLRFVEGRTSEGKKLPAQDNRGILRQDETANAVRVANR